MLPTRSRYQHFAMPGSLFYPLLYGRVLQAALQKAVGRAAVDPASVLRVKPDLRCVTLVPVQKPSG